MGCQVITLYSIVFTLASGLCITQPRVYCIIFVYTWKHSKSAKCVINITYVQHMVLMDAGKNEANKNLLWDGGVGTE